jgi:inner membrane protein
MMLLAHTGITLGAATMLAGAVRLKKKSANGISTWFTSLSEYVDIRILLIGSLLPDIIDKPLGVFFFRDTFSSGRIFAHTLLFTVILAAAGFLLYHRRYRTWLLVLAFGTFIHLILDQIWLTPKTMLWPFLGFTFDRLDVSDWFTLWFRDLFKYPDLYIPEFIGLAILIWFGITMINRKKVGVFLKQGKS